MLAGAEFQTKSLGMPGMHDYRITPDGWLIRCAELTADGKKPRAGTFLARDVDWPLTGRINMGTFRPELGSIEYVVLLSEGRVRWIKRAVELRKAREATGAGRTTRAGASTLRSVAIPAGRTRRVRPPRRAAARRR